MKPIALRAQRGITLVVGMILLVLITLMVTTAFTLNTNNLRAVGNMQFRNEATAAANKALEQVMGTFFPTGFTTLPTAQTVYFDVNNDGTDDYTVVVAVPTCLEAVQVAGTAGTGFCGGVRAGGLSGCSSAQWNTLWDLQATVTDATTGAAVVVNQGFRVQISDTQKTAVCS